MNKDVSLPPRVYEYLNYLRGVLDRSELTVEGYERDLQLFFEYMDSIKNKKPLSSIANKNNQEQIDLSYINDEYLSKITLNDIFGFLSYCNSQRKNASVTRARKASSLRGFFGYISERMKYIPENPTAQLKFSASAKRLPKYLTLEQSRELLNSVEGDNAARDFCILTLFLNCGLRLAELVGLDLSDFDLKEKTLFVVGKGNKQRMLYLNKACVDALNAYLSVRPADGIAVEDKNALFISRNKRRISRLAVQQMVYKYLEKIGLGSQHYSVHKLRHTAATLMYRHGNVDVLVLKNVLGHENLATTEIYTHVYDEQVRQATLSNPLSGENISKTDETKN